jgi:uncharacterized protein YraI
MRQVAYRILILLVGLVLSVQATSAQPLPPGSVYVVVNRDDVNVRIAPALGADIIAFVDAGWTATADARSPDSQWLRIDFNGQEAWIGLPVVSVLSGDVALLAVADPRSIPYGGFESPRSGTTTATGPISGRLANSGLRLRAGPSTAYPVLANPPRYTVFSLLGRTENNAWLQVNFEGTLGWVTASWVEFQSGSILDLPIDGVVASAPPASADTLENYLGTLRFMLDRLNLTQPALDSIRATWTTVSLGQRAACQNFPPRPSNLNIPQPLLAAFYPTLEPLRVDFNSAMANVRLAIDLWIEACGFPQPPSGVVGQATVIGALNTIQAADGLFADLRRRITALLPSFELGADECLFTFQEQFDILKIITQGNLVLDELTPRKNATGYCLDAVAGESLRIEWAQITGNIVPLVSISPFDNPTQFLGVGRNTVDGKLLTLGPISITANARYLIVIADTDTSRADPVQGNYGLLVTNIAGQTLVNPGLGFDPVTGQLVVNPPVTTPLTGLPTPTIGGFVACPSLAFTCEQFISCAEAQACLAAGNFTLDPDNDRIPCEETLCQ